MGNRFTERKDVLDIDTTKNIFQRALRNLNTLIKIMIKGDHDITRLGFQDVIKKTRGRF
jgi:hypothetical protein